jgi:2-deoxystreptamine N-acetyl-D-glucosaminyltransferase/2-deoxystreptamine glucosyltransferase
MEARVPIVASRVGGIPAIVRHGIDGLLVPPSEPRALAEALTQVLTDPELSRRRARGDHTSSRGHDWPSTARKVRGVYEAAVGSRDGATEGPVAVPLRLNGVGR